MIPVLYNNILGSTNLKPPPFITKHPPRVLERDGDIKKRKEVLDGVLMKTDNCHVEAHKLIFAPDRSNITMQDIIVLLCSEFLVLHLRKSKITKLYSAYSDA
ncbi:LOW QUALITY PROTEIN: hypothetical protein MAR_030367 [Mya arenaria]|uniref:Uncharacterized protein n=1 Tax=Mya arenaria TaxID=6604 RepID=A0ABY7DIZ7_MYAAR|nr:LOW QUALITY PROTEIN: hypothetical protein MAR_030367 [Mya arenaria]